MQQRELTSVFAYCQALAALASRDIVGGTVFAKVLAENDDSSRHGVVIPVEAHEHFPELPVGDGRQNVTRRFEAFDCLSGTAKTLSHIYYQRYPERRVTRLNAALSDRQNGMRLGIFVRGLQSDGAPIYLTDCARQGTDPDFHQLGVLLFGPSIKLHPGSFILRNVEAPTFRIDENLGSLLALFDGIRDRGWIDSLRTGDTGIGYTFETLLGIKENNDRRADYQGIEVKCKQLKAIGAGGKINLFQQAPRWSTSQSAIERLRVIGQCGPDGRYTCYSQVTTTPNNLALRLTVSHGADRVRLVKGSDDIGYWLHEVLAARLNEKHARAVFVKASVQNTEKGQRFKYEELVYCERPDIRKFLELVKNRKIVFEFIMSEKAAGAVRNHGYPWRLLGDLLLSQLFSVQVKLR